MAKRGIILCMLLAGVAFGQSFLTPFDMSLLQFAGGDENNWFADGTPQPVAYWRPGISADATDSMGANDGTFVGDATATAEIGFYSDADSYVNLTTNSAIVNVENDGILTYMFWLKTPSVGGTMTAFCRGNWSIACGDSGYFLWLLTSGNYRFNWRENGSNMYAFDTPYSTNEWQHVAFVASNGTKKVYVDGQLKGTGTTGPSAISIATSYPLTAGGGHVGCLTPNYYTGYQDEIILFDAALSDAQVGSYYTNSYNAEFSTR